MLRIVFNSVLPRYNNITQIMVSVRWTCFIVVLLPAFPAQYVFMEEPADEDVLENSNLTLTCAINFYPTSVTWLYNDKPLFTYIYATKQLKSFDSTDLILRQSLTIEIENDKINFNFHLQNISFMKDSGLYKCMVEFENIEESKISRMTSWPANVTVKKPPDVVYLLMNGKPLDTQEIRVVAGSLVEISCVTNSSTPAAILKWHFSTLEPNQYISDGDNIKLNFIENSEFPALFDTILTWNRPFHESNTNTQLECHVEHPGLKERLMAKALLKINCTTCNVFYFENEPENLFIQQNETAIIQCKTSFTPSEVTWFKNNELLFSFPGESSILSDLSLSGEWLKGEANLFIDSVQLGIHDGSYHCEVMSQSNGHLVLRSKSAHLSIFFPVKIQYKSNPRGQKVLSGEIRVKENQNVLLICSTEGISSTSLQLKWIFQVNSGEVFTMEGKQLKNEQKGLIKLRSYLNMQFALDENNVTVWCTLDSSQINNTTYSFTSERINVICQDCSTVYFLKEPENQIINLNITKVELACEINTAIEEVIWLVGDKPQISYSTISENNKPTILDKLQNGVGSLSLNPKTLFTKSGEFKIRCKVRYGSDENSIIISNSAILRFSEHAELFQPTLLLNNKAVSGEIRAREKQTVFIKCIVYNTVIIPTLKWKVGNKTLPETDIIPVTIKNRPSSLGYDVVKAFGRQLSYSDNGKFLTCSAEKSGWPTQSFEIKLKIFCETCPVFDIIESMDDDYSSSNTYAKNSQNDFTKFTYEFNFIPLLYESYKDDILIKSETILYYTYDVINPFLKYSILLKLLDISDQGTYRFQFFYGLGQDNFISSRPKVISIGNFSHVSIQTRGNEPNEIRVLSGQAIKIDCEAKGGPLSMRWWIKDMEYSTDKYEASKEGHPVPSNYMLSTIFNFTKELDNSFIDCKVDFGSNQIVRKRVRLKVFDSYISDFIYEPEDLLNTADETGKLLCKVNFQPQRIDWYKNDILIFSTITYGRNIPKVMFKSKYENGESWLIFIGLDSILHSGLYHCLAYYDRQSYITSRQAAVFPISPPNLIILGLYQNQDIGPIDRQLQIRERTSSLFLYCKTYSNPTVTISFLENNQNLDVFTTVQTHHWHDNIYETKKDLSLNMNYSDSDRNITCSVFFPSTSRVLNKTIQIKVFCENCKYCHFTKTPEDKMVPQGTPVIFEYIVNFIALDVTFYKDEKYLFPINEPNDGYYVDKRNENGETHIIFHIKQAKHVDNGQYFIEVKYKEEKSKSIVSPSTSLMVFKKAKELLLLVNGHLVIDLVQLREGDNVSFSCQATDSYPPTKLKLFYRHEKNLEQLEMNNITENKSETGTYDTVTKIFVASVELKIDKKELVCQASHLGTLSEISVPLRIQCKDCPEIHILSQPEDVIGNAFAFIELPCKTAFTLSHDKVFWYRNGKRLLASPEKFKPYLSLSNNGSLMIHNLQPGRDEGSYYCLAYYGDGPKDYIVSRIANISVQKAPSNVFITDETNTIPHQITVESYRNITLTCQAINAKPPPKLNWQVNGAPIKQITASYTTTKSDTYLNLFNASDISNFQIEPEANNFTLMCVYSHNALDKPLETSIRLNVQTGVSNVTINVIQSWEVENTVNLHCKIIGQVHPLPRFKWIVIDDKNLQEIGVDSSVTVHVNCSQTVTYRCIVTNIVNNKVYNASSQLKNDNLELCQKIIEKELNASIAKDSAVSKNNAAFLGLIIGGIIGGIIVLLLVLLIPVIIYRYKRRRLPTHLMRSDNRRYDPPSKSYEYVFSPENATEMRNMDARYFERPFEVDDWSDPSNLDIKLVSKIGEGRFGEVHLAVATNLNGKNDLAKVAVKTLKGPANPEIVQRFIHEIRLHRMITSHPNVIIFLGNYKCRDDLGMVLEYLENGDLKEFLQRNSELFLRGQPFSEDEEWAVMSRQLVTFAWQIVKGMDHIARHKIVHRDLATRNILLDINMNCKISDFGMARITDDNKEYFMISLDPLPIRWMAPESMADRAFSTKSDIWSFGVTLWEIVTLGATPYPELHRSIEVIRRVKSGFIMKKPHHCKNELYGIMTKCWRTTPENRPNFNELIRDFELFLSNDKDYINFLDYNHRHYEYKEVERFSELFET